MLPNFIIIGAPRAGTTWMAKNIALHPDVFIPRKKEIHFFDRHYDQGRAFYESWFEEGAGKSAVGEATPAYLFTPGIPEKIKDLVPQARLVVSLRNPVDRLYSRYWNAKGNFRDDWNWSFEEKLSRQPAVIEEGYYVDHLARYYEHFPRERILVVLFEDIEDRPGELLRNIYSFLEVDESFESPLLSQRINSSVAQKGFSQSKMLWYASKALRRVGGHKLAGFVSKLNERPLPPMDPRTRAWLVHDVYREKNIKLQDLIGMDLGRWNSA